MPPSTRVPRGKGKYRGYRAKKEEEAPKLKKWVQNHRGLKKLPILKDALACKR